MTTQTALATLFSLIMLSACSSAPSDADIKNVVLKNMRFDGCQYLSLDNIKKLNGIASNDNRHYEISYAYTIKAIPLPDADSLHKAMLETQSNKIKMLEKAKSEELAFENTMKGRDLNAEDRDLSRQLSNEVSNAKRAAGEQELRKLETEIIEKRYLEGCSNLNSSTRQFMTGFVYGLTSKDKSWFKNQNEKVITDNLQFIKTDNGWMPTN